MISPLGSFSLLAAAAALMLWCDAAWAQRDPPVFESHLPAMAVYPQSDEDRSLFNVEFVYRKYGGPFEHTHHQAIVFLYLAKDEARVLQLAADDRLNRRLIDGRESFLHQLESEGLVARVGSAVSQRRRGNRGTSDESAVAEPVESTKGGRLAHWELDEHSFLFQFQFSSHDLFEAMQGLANFDPENVRRYSHSQWHNDRFKLLVFVPTNDSGYATDVLEKLQTTSDAAHLLDYDAGILYFRPLPYEFVVVLYQSKEEPTIYVN